MKVSLKTISPNIETNIVEIARVSSSRKDKSEAPEGLINYLIKNSHWSPFEHGFLTFEVETSKAIGIQLLRHRSNYFQEFSQRYQNINVLDNLIFELYEVRRQKSNNRQSSTEEIADLCWTEEDGYIFNRHNSCDDDEFEALKLTEQAYNLAEKAYNAQLEAGIARECARFVLPMATKTRLYITMNVRSVIHWLDLRDDGHAQKEVQLIAKEVKRIFVEQCPIISKARGYE